MQRHLATAIAALAAAASVTAVDSSASASTSVTSMLMFGIEGKSLVASVIAVDAPAATTFFVKCGKGVDSSDCGLGPGLTMVQGPSTFGVHLTEKDAVTLDETCIIKDKSKISCTLTNLGPEANDPGTSTDATTTDLAALQTPVTITAGLEKIVSASATAMASATGSSGNGTSSGAAPGIGALGSGIAGEAFLSFFAAAMVGGVAILL